MAIELDNLHYSFREIDGYNKAFNFVLSARELGKTSRFWYLKVYRPWKVDKRPWIYMVRTTVEITEALINSIADTIINKFSDDNITFEYNKGSFKDGIVDVRIDGVVFIRIVSLSIPLRRIKLAVLAHIKGALMDEYIINPRNGEKYQPSEAFKIKEAYTTWRREADGIFKMYFLANPYSLYNPLFVDWNTPVNELRKGEFYVGEHYVIHWAIMKPELRAMLLEINPLYEFDEDYKGYALEGSAINDANIRLGRQPQGYQLRFVFRCNNKYIGIFYNTSYELGDDRYFVKEVDTVSAKRVVYCYDFAEMVDRCQLLAFDDRNRLQAFKDAIRKRQVIFEDVNVYYMIEEVYKVI